MRRVVLLLCLMSLATPALAQQRLFARMPGEVVELDPRPATLGTVVRRFALPPGASPVGGRAVAFAGGDALLWNTGPHVVLLHTRTGAVTLVAVPGVGGIDRILGTDGVNRIAFLASGTDLVVLADARTGSVRTLDVGPIPTSFAFSGNRLIAYAPETDLLFVARARGTGFDNIHDVDVVDAVTGLRLRTIDIAPVSADALITSVDGRRLFVTEGARGTFAYDPQTGALLAGNSTDAVLQSIFLAELDESRDRLVTSVPPHTGLGEAGEVTAFSASTLQRIGAVHVPELPLPAPTPRTSAALTQALDISSVSATGFVLQAVSVATKNGATTCRESQLIAFDASTGFVRQTVDTTATLGSNACFGDLIRLTEPAAPRDGRVDVTGHRATLTWRAAPGAMRYEVEAGTAPGRTDVVLAVNETRLVVDDLPTGVYYVRLRALNSRGKSGPTPEVRVVVP